MRSPFGTAWTMLLAALAALAPFCCCGFTLSPAPCAPAEHACGHSHADAEPGPPADNEDSRPCSCPRVESSLPPESTPTDALANPEATPAALPECTTTRIALVRDLPPSPHRRPPSPPTSLLRLHCALVV